MTKYTNINKIESKVTKSMGHDGPMNDAMI